MASWGAEVLMAHIYISLLFALVITACRGSDDRQLIGSQQLDYHIAQASMTRLGQCESSPACSLFQFEFRAIDLQEQALVAQMFSLRWNDPDFNLPVSTCTTNDQGICEFQLSIDEPLSTRGLNKPLGVELSPSNRPTKNLCSDWQMGSATEDLNWVICETIRSSEPMKATLSLGLGDISVETLNRVAHPRERNRQNLQLALTFRLNTLVNQPTSLQGLEVRWTLDIDGQTKSGMSSVSADNEVKVEFNIDFSPWRNEYTQVTHFQLAPQDPFLDPLSGSVWLFLEPGRTRLSVSPSPAQISPPEHIVLSQIRVSPDVANQSFELSEEMDLRLNRNFLLEGHLSLRRSLWDGGLQHIPLERQRARIRLYAFQEQESPTEKEVRIDLEREGRFLIDHQFSQLVRKPSAPPKLFLSVFLEDFHEIPSQYFRLIQRVDGTWVVNPSSEAEVRDLLREPHVSSPTTAAAFSSQCIDLHRDRTPIGQRVLEIFSQNPIEIPEVTRKELYYLLKDRRYDRKRERSSWVATDLRLREAVTFEKNFKWKVINQTPLLNPRGEQLSFSIEGLASRCVEAQIEDRCWTACLGDVHPRQARVYWTIVGEVEKPSFVSQSQEFLKSNLEQRATTDLIYQPSLFKARTVVQEIQ
jgi:hypothetical protein